MVEMTRHPAFKRRVVPVLEAAPGRRGGHLGKGAWWTAAPKLRFGRHVHQRCFGMPPSQDFDRVYVMEMEIRKQNGGKPPEDPELLVWEAKYRDLYHREDFSMSPWLSKKIERLPGWTWELDDESGLEGTKEMLREKERQRDAKAREKMEQGDVVDRTALRAAETQETIINQIKKWFT
eukprot:scaffold676_cov273-Pinguiococcus_pyrenoidosus.AAC.7